MRRQGCVLVGIGRCDIGGSRQFPFQRLPNAEQLPCECADRGLGQRPPRDDQMIDAHGFDLVVRPRRRRTEGAAGNFLGFVERMLLRDRLGDVDRQEFRFAALARGGGDGFRGDLAVERSHRHEGVDRRVMRHLADLVDRELGHRDLVRIDAGFLQDDLEQLHVGLRRSDHAETMSGEFLEALDLRRRGFLGALGRQAGRRPQHDDVLAQDGHRLRIARHVEIAARHREVGLVGAEQREAFGRPAGRDRREPDRHALLREGLRQGLDQLLVVAVGRADRDAQGFRPQGEVKRGRSGNENKYSCNQDEKRKPIPLFARLRRRVRLFEGGEGSIVSLIVSLATGGP